MSLSLAGSGQISGFDAGLSGFGGLVAVKFALFTGFQTNSTAGGADFAVTDLSITHSLSDASNKLIISAYVGLAASSNQFANVGIAIADGATLIGVGTETGSFRTPVAAAGRVGTASNVTGLSHAVQFVYEPGDTVSHTYTVRAANLQSGTNTIYINRDESGGDATGRPTASSALVIQEVKA